MAFCGCNRRREFFFIVYKVVPEITPKKTNHAENKKIVRKPFFHARCKINTIASIWRKYLHTRIIFPWILSDVRIAEFSIELCFRKTVRILERTMPADHYSCILLRKIEAIVDRCLCIPKVKFKKAAKAIHIFRTLACSSLLSD